MRDIDSIALDAAKRIRKIDPDTLLGGEVRATAQVQVIVIEAIREAMAGEDYDHKNPIAIENLTFFTFSTSKGGFAIPNELGVGVVHKPTGIEIRCGSERSAHANRKKALDELERRLVTKIVARNSSENASQS